MRWSVTRGGWHPRWPEQETWRATGMRWHGQDCAHARNHRSVGVSPGAVIQSRCDNSRTRNGLSLTGRCHTAVPRDLLRGQRGSLRKEQPVPVSLLWLWTGAAKTEFLFPPFPLSAERFLREICPTLDHHKSWERSPFGMWQYLTKKNNNNKKCLNGSRIFYITTTSVTSLTWREDCIFP